MRRTFRIVAVAAASIAVVAVTATTAAWISLRASLPLIDGTAALDGLGANLIIERDAAGVPTITALNRDDLARGLGFVHGQDRFFQMDLLRRAAAGELSALLGPSLLNADRQFRLHRFRSVAHNVVAGLDARQRGLLDAYVAGVNAGLASLKSRPFEYWLLRSRPQPWSAEDSILCIHAMYLQLQDAEGHAQLQRGLLRAMLPEAAWKFIETGAPEWDAAVDGSHDAEPRLPLAAEFNLREIKGLPVMPPDGVLRKLEALGSNNWAVAGTRTATGAALVANDMHLEYRVPNIWYRARLIDKAEPDALELTGVTLPGTPAAVAGSNGSIAWGFTNSYGEFATVIRLAPATDATTYQTAAGARRFHYVDEILEVAGAPAEHLKIALTEWGPVVGNDWEGRPYALQWTPQDPAATNLNLLMLEHAHTVRESLQAAATFGIPGQNFVVADKGGHIGWTIAGRLPSRSDGGGAGVPQLSTDAVVGFTGWLAPEQQPQVTDPISGYLWSANARVVAGPAAALIGDDGMARGARDTDSR